MLFLQSFWRSQGRVLLSLILLPYSPKISRFQAQASGTAPTISSSPLSQNLGQGLQLDLRTSANLFSNVSYQWFHDGNPIPAATNQLFSRPAADFSDSGIYFATAANSVGSVTSAPARVTIVPKAQLRHLSMIPTPFTYWIKVIDGKAYIANTKFESYDVSDPQNPVKIGSFAPRNTQIYAFAIDGNMAYVNNGQVGGLLAVDISNPALPVQTGRSQTGSINLDLIARGGKVYSATPTGLDIYDVNNPAKPALIGTYKAGSPVYTVELRGNIVYLATTGGGVQVVDVTDPTQIRLIALLSEIHAPDTVKIVGNRLYASGTNFAVYDLRDPASPRFLGAQALPSSNSGSVWTTGMSATGNFMLTGYKTTRLYDLANPEQPALIEELPIAAESVDFVENHIYVTSTKGVDIFEWLPSTNAPVVTSPFTNTSGVEGSPARLMANASGGEELTWQWFKQGVALSGETNRYLNIPAVTPDTIGEYSAQVNNSVGAVSSGTATLSISAPPPLALSVRLGGLIGPKLRFSLPDGFQSRLESSDLTNWNVIWSGQGSGSSIEIFDPAGKGQSSRFYRLKYGVDLK